MVWVLKEPRMKRPRGGWRAEELGVEVVEDNPEALAARIAKMRRLNGLDEGDPMAEICARLAETDPWMVMHRDDAEKPAERRADPFLKSVEEWTFGYLRQSPKFAHVHDQKQRAEVCRGCPMNVTFRQKSEEERKRYWRSLMIASRGEAEAHEGLGGCKAFSHDNRLAVLLESVTAPRQCCGQESAAPMKCWVG